MAKPENGAGESLEAALSGAVDAGLDRVVDDTTDGSDDTRAAYGNLKDPILGKLLTMENGQAFEITFNASEIAQAFAAGFNELAPKTDEFLYGAIAEGSVLSLKRMEPIGFIVQDGKSLRF